MNEDLHDIRHMIEGDYGDVGLFSIVTAIRDYLDRLDDRVCELEFNDEYREAKEMNVKTFDGNVWRRTGCEWENIEDIPAGVLVVPEFDDLVHPMRKTVYAVVNKSYRHPGGNERVFIDESDGEQFSAEQFDKWWGWVPKFVEVKR
ncbi:hypothetical protein [Nocardia jiangxiensis]|uniref:hypothetical protein n=1 Tax=Nocardia jiangxiensis TaxID=282685 RepID=UPI0002FE749B|nr:hypothetical protein [Nocardia jiangxiensis]